MIETKEFEEIKLCCTLLQELTGSETEPAVEKEITTLFTSQLVPKLTP